MAQDISCEDHSCFGISSAFTGTKARGEANAVDDESLGSAILIGIWIFFVTARPRREFSRAQTESLHVYDLGDSYPIDDWSFDPSGSDGGIIEQADSWVLR